MDDTLSHQIPSTFDHVGTSDPRFFDRYWFAVNDPAGGGALQFTLGAYQNMNVMDGGFVVIHEGRQYNVRVSRSLRPHYATMCGPLRVEVIEPLQRFGLVVTDAGQSVHGELEWTAVMPAQEEVPRFTRVRGRVVEESRRFDQIGQCSGWLDIEGRRLDLDHWWAARDHSWGVRQAMGIVEPATGPTVGSGAGRLFAFLFFSTDIVAGHVQLAQFSGQPDHLTALLTDRRHPEQGDIEVPDATLAVEFYDDGRPRRFRKATLDLRLVDGRSAVVDLLALGPSIAMPGLGYGGYDDGLGLGVWRGVDHLEHDVWDVTHHRDVRRGDGRVDRPVHRIQPVHVTMRDSDGFDSEGTGSMTLIAEGSLPRLGVA
jgi:hypothetical protein